MKSIFHLEEAFETEFGIVVTGRMKIGDVEKGNFLLMPDGNKIEVAGIEYAKKSFGMKGDNVSILLKDVTRDYIKESYPDLNEDAYKNVKFLLPYWSLIQHDFDEIYERINLIEKKEL
jgi:hypothetical protein